jgi:hypothetical protein
MFKLLSVTMVLGLALVAIVASTASAYTPEEQAAFREEARQLTEQARAQEAQAETARDLAQQIFIAEYKKADGVDDQADFKKITALQKWLQAGAHKHAKASGLRETALSLILAAYRFGVLAALVDEQAQNERSRATWQRQAADALLANDPDPEASAIADELNRQAAKDDRDAAGSESEAENLRERADRTNARAAALIQRAVELETAP